MDHRFAKIIATIGPASQDPEILENLCLAGMNVARLNFSHGTHEQHLHTIQNIRNLSKKLGVQIPILQDLQGPKLRIGYLVAGEKELHPGELLQFTTSEDEQNKELVLIDIPNLPAWLHPGDRILIDDGNLELVTISTSKTTITAEIITGGILKSHKGINLPKVKLNIPCLTDKDRQDLAFGLAHKVDAVAISFVKNTADILQVKKTMGDLKPGYPLPPIIAKLERAEAIQNMDNIVQTADGVMIARGDLGVEIPPEEVPIAQKQIIEDANMYLKYVITATQMLDSMIHSPRPTRAEASDVANAIFDGTDAVMLSGETASGLYPVESVKMMDAIIRQAEANIQRWGRWKEIHSIHGDDAISITKAAKELAQDRQVSSIAVFTSTGRTASLMAKTRPDVPIFAFTPDPYTVRRLGLLWGVQPHLVPFSDSVEGMIHTVEVALLSNSDIKPGQQVILITGFPVGSMRPPNLILLHSISE